MVDAFEDRLGIQFLDLKICKFPRVNSSVL